MTSIRVAFGIFAGLCVVGVVFSLVRGNLQRTAVLARGAIGEKGSLK